MASEQSPYDMAMKFVLEGGGTVWAESTLVKDPNDDLMRDFQPAKSLDDYSNFFEITTFDIGMSVEPDDGEGGAGGRPGPAGKPALPALRGARPSISQAAGLLMTGPAGRGDAAPGTGSSDAFHRWRSATEKEAMEMNFQLHFESFTFTRIVDGASPSFFQNCANQTSFESAALIKRVSRGTLGGTRLPLAFMRFDFKNVMLKKVTWEDGELVTENCEFVCDWLSFQYRQQQPNGDLKPVAHVATWDRDRDAERKKQDRNNGR